MMNNEVLMFLDRNDPSSPELGVVARRLLVRTRSSRTTVRLCRPDGEVALVAEARRDGVPSMAEARTEGIRAASTYTYLETVQEILVQNDCRTGEPSPPPSLIRELRVYAQMLAPVAIDGSMVATISVHQQGETRDWDRFDIDALTEAQANVRRFLESPNQARFGSATG